MMHIRGKQSTGNSNAYHKHGEFRVEEMLEKDNETSDNVQSDQ